MLDFFIGEEPSRTSRALAQELGWGIMTIAAPPPKDSLLWALDNAAFRWAVAGVPFQGDTFLERLKRGLALGRTRPHFVVLPDDPQLTPQPRGGRESLYGSLYWLNYLPPTIPWYLAVQDGMDPEEIGEVLADWPLRGLFLGGSDAFKKDAARWCDLAHEHGVAFHYARCGTLRKLQHAVNIGADSADSALPQRHRDKYVRFAQEWSRLARQPTLSWG